MRSSNLKKEVLSAAKSPVKEKILFVEETDPSIRATLSNSGISVAFFSKSLSSKKRHYILDRETQ